MPYIKQNRREDCDLVVKLLKEIHLRADGDLNYILYKFCKEAVDPSYNRYKNFIGELHECAHEIRRRLLSKYEDEKIDQNGDV